MEFVVFFEIFGKKMKTTVKADSQQDAEYKLRQKIQERTKFYKSVPKINMEEGDNPFKGFDDTWKNIFGKN